MSSLLEKGIFEPIDDVFLTKSLDIFQSVSEIQEEYGRGDTDTFLNEVRDSVAAKYLGFTHVNMQKHGFDARRAAATDLTPEYLEVKSASFDASTWSATFNDTNIDKANAFKRSDVYLCLSVWRYASEPVFFAYGQNPAIGDFLEERMLNRPTGSRSTQTISLQNLVNRYGFKIYSVTKTPEQLFNILQMKPGCRGISLDDILPISELPL